MCEEEFILIILPINQFDPFHSNASDFVVSIHADITLLTHQSDDEFDEDKRDFERTTQERFLYYKDLKMDRQDWKNEILSRVAIVKALNEMEFLPEKHYEEIVVGVLEFVKGEEFGQCGGVSVDIELVKYEDDEDGMDGIEPTFEIVLADSKRGQCVICLDWFLDGLEVCKLKCHHLFHKKCLLNWLDCNVSCPLCRIEPPNYCGLRPT